MAERQVVLASDSPRRRELIEALDAPVTAVSPGYDEGPRRAGETPNEFVLRLSREKTHSAAARIGDGIVLGADTTVVLDDEVLGKPGSAAEAAHMLRRLKGRTHTVITGVTAVDGRTGRSLSAIKSTQVTMRAYSDAEASSYVASGEPLDKAGGYAVQDPLFRPAESLRGCYLNVVGLPLCEITELMRSMGLPARLRKDWQPPDECRDCPLVAEREAMKA